MLCTMLAPSSALGQELGYLEFNNRFNPQIVPFTLNSGLIGNGANLNLNTLYVLTSSQTASASEMVINCLAPYMDVVIIGGTTVGKNVGSRNFSSPELMITMNPIVCKIYNSEGKSDYESGFQPAYSGYVVNEMSDMSRFPALWRYQRSLIEHCTRRHRRKHTTARTRRYPFFKSDHSRKLH